MKGIFPSTSEVYGMSDDESFDEDNSKLILGPIRKQRWIYSCSKQLLDRVIYAYGETRGLEFTIFRPFNWVGPRLDSLSSARIGSSRVITQLILNLVEGTPIQLVDGGERKRCFTDAKDGVECLFRIIENKNDRCNHKIINIGNPDNESSIKNLAGILIDEFEKHPMRHHFPPFAGICETESLSFYGKGYEDVQHRKPRIDNAWKLLGWQPNIKLEQSIRETLTMSIFSLIKPGQLNVLTIHAEAEGIHCFNLFENFIRQAQSMKIRILPLRELIKDFFSKDVSRVVNKEIKGRHGKVATQVRYVGN